VNHATDASAWADPADDLVPEVTAYLARRPATHAPGAPTSHYLAMRDGVRLAIDLHLPADLGATQIPAIVRQTRYFRSTEVAAWARRLLGDAALDPTNARMRQTFVTRGYAWIDVDVRGSGASSGVWHSPWSPLEVADGAEVVDWICRQPWSSGVVGATGNSYDGTAAELLATTCHPAVRAVAPRCSLYDVYADIAYPGGLHQVWFTEAWTRTNMALDAGHPERMVAEAIAQAHPSLATGLRRRAFERVLRRIFRRVRAVDGDLVAVARAMAERAANIDLDRVARMVEFRDDTHATPLGRQTIDEFSPSAYLDRMIASGVAVLGVSGWFDAAYPAAAIKRHGALVASDRRGRNRLVLGPWNHGAQLNMSPHARRRRTGYALDAELLRFFDHHLYGRATGIEAEPPVRYYVMGAEAWREATAWPPPHLRPRRFYLGPDRALVEDRPGVGRDPLEVDPAAGSGRRSRWRTLVSPFVRADYPDRRARGRALVVYATAPLATELEVVGWPVVGLRLRADGDDGAVFAYLEEEHPDGRIRYVTEGQLRLIHGEAPRPGHHHGAPSAPYRSFRREHARAIEPGAIVDATFELLPTAYAFARGSRIRLALAGADVDHFAPVRGARVATRYQVERGGADGSWLELPCVGADRGGR